MSPNHDLPRHHAPVWQPAMALSAALLLATAPAGAHTAASTARNANDLTLFADVRQSFRDEPPLAWAVPGFLPGGDIGPDAEGLSLAHAGAVLRVSHETSGLYGLLEASAHGHHDGESALAIEQAWLAQDVGAQDGGGLNVAVGRQFATLGLRNATHGPAADFPDTGPVYRVFLGEHYVDDGVALTWRATDAISVGAGAWRGVFPAGGIDTDGNAALTGHVDARTGIAGGTLLVRLSVLAADAALRYDERYAPGHSHDPFSPTPDLAYFTGDSTLGIASLQWQSSPASATGANPPRVTLSGEYFARDERGEIRNLTQRADYEGTQSGLVLEALVRPVADGHFSLGARFATLSADNTLSGPGATTLATVSGLTAEGTPTEFALVGAWRLDARQTVRLQVSEGGDYAGGDSVLLQYAFTWTTPLAR